MSYNAKIYQVFIASPADVADEREVVRKVIERWNAINSNKTGVVLLPVSWETHAAPEYGRPAQQIINETILEQCDMLIALFWTRIGSKTNAFDSGTIEEIERHVAERKLAMIYFSTNDLPSNCDLDQVDKVRQLKAKMQREHKGYYGEFRDKEDLSNKLYDHIQIKVHQGKFRPTFDSDIISAISDDTRLIEEIHGHFPLVARNVLFNIIDEPRTNAVWEAIVTRLERSPADLRAALIELAKQGAFRHRAFVLGCEALSNCNQADFFTFMQALYSINKYEFWDLYNQGLLHEAPYTEKFMTQIYKPESC